uniref:PDZ domain-containing protein n=1 Tax=Chlamydomonas euryale TaxID=1486919 RepID=A0A7R9VQK3_9CHLO
MRTMLTRTHAGVPQRGADGGAAADVRRLRGGPGAGGMAVRLRLPSAATAAPCASRRAAAARAYRRDRSGEPDARATLHVGDCADGSDEPSATSRAGVLALAAVMSLSSFAAPLGIPLSAPPARAEAMQQVDASTGGMVVTSAAANKAVRAASVLQSMTMAAPELPAGLDVEETSNIRIFQQNTPSVVNITNLRSVTNDPRMSLNAERVPVGTGSGFVWDKLGHIVTNFHVISGASEVQVTLLDQSTWRAKVVGFDPDKDVAVLKIEGMSKEQMEGLKPVTLGASDLLLVGQKVYAIGNPFGLDHTLTSGIISGLGRELTTGMLTIKNVIQTDAAINPGNSGGVLLDSRGRVIGINSAIADPTGKGASSGVGFAIPISMVEGLVDQILTYGRVMRPALGVTIAPPQLLLQLRIPGVLIFDVPAGSPAAVGGLKGTYRDRGGRLVLGDVITGINGRPVKSYSDLFGLLDDQRVGDTVTLQLLRADGGDELRPIEAKVKLGERVLGQAAD